jgi:hypothetical protein
VITQGPWWEWFSSNSKKRLAELEQENALRDKRIYELLAELKSAEHFLTQIDPVHWPSRGEAREQIKLIREVIAKGGERGDT